MSASTGTANVAAFRALFLHALNQTLRGRRLIGLAVIALIPAVLVVAIRSLAPASVTTDDYQDAIAFLAFGLIVPLIALFLGVSVLRDELETGSIVHLSTRGVSRGTIFVARTMGAVTTTVILATASLVLVSIVLEGPDGQALGKAAVLSALAALPYTALFGLLGSLMRKAVLLGLGYIVAWEGVVASSPWIFREWTISYWVRSIAAEESITEPMISTTPASTGTAAVVLLLIAVVCIAAGGAWFAHRELPGAEPE